MVATNVRPEFGPGDDYPTEATPMPELEDLPGEAEQPPDGDYAEGQGGDAPIDYDELIDHHETGPDDEPGPDEDQMGEDYGLAAAGPDDDPADG